MIAIPGPRGILGYAKLRAFTQPTVGNTVAVNYSGLAPPPGLGVAAVRNGAAVGLYVITALTATTITLQLEQAVGVAEGDSVPAGAGLVVLGENGANGTNGADGADGADGNTVLYGVGAPASNLGVDGNFYIAYDTHYIYGPKAVGSWPAGTSIVGPAGANGSNGTNGTNGAAGAPGPTYGFDPALHGYTTGNVTSFAGSISPGLFFFVQTTGMSFTGANVAWKDASNRTLKVSLWDDAGNTRYTKNQSHTGNAAVQIYTVTFDTPVALNIGKRYILAVWDGGTNYTTLNVTGASNYWQSDLSISRYVQGPAGCIYNGWYYGTADTKPGTGNSQTTAGLAATPIFSY